MKLRSTLLLLVSMLLIGSLAGAATADPAGVPAAPASAVAASPVAASPLCLANTSKVQLPAGNPVVLLDNTTLCAACSDLWCQGQTPGAICRTGNPMYRCQNLFRNFCAQDGASQCTCWNKQLP